MVWHGLTVHEDRTCHSDRDTASQEKLRVADTRGIPRLDWVSTRVGVPVLLTIRAPGQRSTRGCVVCLREFLLVQDKQVQ